MFPTLLFDDETISADALRDRALRAASGLAGLGVGDSDVVAIMLRNEPSCIEAILAVRHLNAYWVGLNWHFKAEEANWVLTDSHAKALIVHADLYAQIADGIPAGLPVLVVQAAPLTRRQYKLPDRTEVPTSTIDWNPWVDAQQPSQTPHQRGRGLMPYTSGTTGRPKGVKRLPPAPDKVAEYTQAMTEVVRTVFGVDAQSRCLLSAPIYHSAPASYAAFCASSGATLRLEPRFDASRVLSLIATDRISHLYLVPTMYRRLLALPEAERQAADLSSVKFVGSTGSPCPAATKAAMIDWWGPVIHEAYASSETGYVTFIHASDWLTHPGSAGKPVGQAVLKIIDDDGRELPPGQVGSIYARQPASTDFVYANNPDARGRIDRDGLVTLGDMGYLDDEGFLYISDRKSDMVISGGVNIYPTEIESVLATMPGVGDCAVFGIPDDEFGEALAAAVQTVNGAVLSEAAVREFLRERIAGYKVPKQVEFHDALPREDTGKIFKRKLRAPHWEKAGRNI
jgi:long-chain acyl-CoA synthetase